MRRPILNTKVVTAPVRGVAPARALAQPWSAPVAGKPPRCHLNRVGTVRFIARPAIDPNKGAAAAGVADGKAAAVAVVGVAAAIATGIAGGTKQRRQ